MVTLMGTTAITSTNSKTKFWWFAPALRASLREYSRQNFIKDLFSGLVVGLVAIPLSMALAVAIGVPPQMGLITAVTGGIIVAALGGSRFQVTGPTAAFVVILIPVVQEFGPRGLLFAGFLAGILLMGMGFLKFGQLIQYIPHPVTTGFTSGIAVVIAVLQIKDFFGLKMDQVPSDFPHRVEAIFQALPSFSPFETGTGLVTLAIIVFWNRWIKKVPAPLVALVVVTVVSEVLSRAGFGFHVATIQTQYGEIPSELPGFQWPWDHPGSDVDGVSWEFLKAILPASIAIAMLGSIESLLSAVVADGVTQTKHDPNAELVALGVGNIVGPVFGAIPSTGALARTATNIRMGAFSPISAMVHGVFVLLCLIFLAPWVSKVPMAALAALLLFVAYNMSEAKHFWRILRVGGKEDRSVLLACFLMTVVFDMTIGVLVGFSLASLLFIYRMSQMTEIKMSLESVSGKESKHLTEPQLGKGVLNYEIAGPLFFGAAQRAMGSISRVSGEIDTVSFNLSKVPMMDVTGLLALESAVSKIQTSGRKIRFEGLTKEVRSFLEKSNQIKKFL